MNIGIYAFSFLVALTSLPSFASPQEPLGDLARQLRQEQLKSGPKGPSVYTNDNLPGRSQKEERAAASGMSSTPANTSSDATRAERDSSQVAEQNSKTSETDDVTSKSETPEDKMKTKEYWQRKFKAARARLADAQERQQLAEDELNLLQIQEVRELNDTRKAELTEKVKAKQEEVAQALAVTEEAQKALDDLQSEFDSSGAPAEWSETGRETETPE